MNGDDPRARPPLPAKVLVTGGAGFIGAALLSRLRELGVEAVGVDVVADPASGVHRGDTTDPASWAHLLDDAGAVIHTAAIVSNAATLDEAWRVNVLGTRRVIEAASAAGVPRLVHLSSIMAFGFDYPDGADETWPVRLTGHSYPDTRVNSEAVVMTAHAAGEISATVVRPGDVYGPGSIWVREPLRMLRARQAVLPARGEGVFTPIYVDDLVDGILLALACPEAEGQVFTLTDGHAVTCREYFGRIADWVGRPLMTLPTSVARPVSSLAGAALRAMGRDSELTAASVLMLSRRGSYSIEKARRVLGFEPRIDLDEGLARSEAWAREVGLLD